MPILKGISYAELPIRDLGETSQEGSKRVRGYRVAWADKEAMIVALLGISTAVGGQSFWELPEPCEEGSLHVASSCTLQGHGPQQVDSSGRLWFPEADILCTFTISQQDPEQTGGGVGPWADVSKRSWVEMLTIDAPGLMWLSDSVHLKEDQHAIVCVARSDITICRYACAVIDEDAFNAMLGKLNSVAFRGRAIKTLMFQDWTSARSIAVDGTTTEYDVTVQVAWRSFPWDQMWRPGKGWKQVVRTDAVELFETSDFGTL
jgi:hypothetical protein